MKKQFALIFVLGATAWFRAQAQVTTVEWDPDAVAGNGANGGAGTWNLILTNWFDGANDVSWNNDGTYRAVFGGDASGNVQVGSGLILVAESVVFTNVAGYNISGGGARRLTVLTGNVETYADATITVPITNPPIATNLVGIIKKGPAKLSIAAGNNGFLGGLFVLEGTLAIWDKQAIGAANGSLTVNGATLELGGVWGISDRVLYIGNNGATINIPTNNDSWNFQMVRDTNGTLTKIGPGRLGFTSGAAGAFIDRIGPTIANEGILSVETPAHSGTGSGPVTINTNATLTGSGLIGGPTTVRGIIAPGTTTTAVRALTFGGGLDLSEGGVYNWQLGSLKDSSDGIAGTDFDQIVLTNGNLALGGSSKLNISFTGAATAPELGEPFWQANRSWTIVNLSETASNSPASNFASLQNASYPAGTFATSVGTNGSIILTFTSASVVNPPHIDAIVVTDRTNATITWSSVSGRMYEVRYNTNLNTTNWTAFTNITAMGGSTTITHIVAAGDAQRYYRVVLLP